MGPKKRQMKPFWELGERQKQRRLAAVCTDQPEAPSAAPTSSTEESSESCASSTGVSEGSATTASAFHDSPEVSLSTDRDYHSPIPSSTLGIPDDFASSTTEVLSEPCASLTGVSEHSAIAALVSDDLPEESLPTDRHFHSPIPSSTLGFSDDFAKSSTEVSSEPCASLTGVSELSATAAPVFDDSPEVSPPTDRHFHSLIPSSTLGIPDDFGVFQPDSSASDDDVVSTARSPQEDSALSDSDVPSDSSDDADRDSSDSDDKNNYMSVVVEKLRAVAQKHTSLTQNALSDILKVFQENVPALASLPRDARSVLQTPTTVEIRTLQPGEYYYFGIKENLEIVLQNSSSAPLTLDLGAGIDAVPLFDGSKYFVLPIMGNVMNIPSFRDHVFPIAIYAGYEKPNSFDEFLGEFVEEINRLSSEGFDFQGKHYRSKIHCLCMDTPAKADVMGTIGHAGYNSCPRCKVVGVQYTDSRMSFYDINAEPRTHEEFISRAHPNYQTRLSVISELKDVDLVKVVPFDYLHAVCLGIVKKTIRKFWIAGLDHAKRGKLSAEKMATVSEKLIFCNSFKPLEFNRFARPLSVSAFWKGTEFRSFLICIGPVVMKGVHDNRAVYDHFICLHVAMTILLRPKLCTPENIEKADLLLRRYVETFCSLYGKRFASPNVHFLSHLAEDTRRYGSLDNCATFRFENELKNYKQLIRKPHQCLQQAVKRLKERGSSRIKQRFKGDFWKCLNYHENGPLTSSCQGPQFEKLKRSGITIRVPMKPRVNQDSAIRDSVCGMSNGDIVVMDNIAFSTDGEQIIVGRKFKKLDKLYSKPIPSTELGIFLVDQLSETHETWKVADVMLKYVVVPSEHKFAVYPIEEF